MTPRREPKAQRQHRAAVTKSLQEQVYKEGRPWVEESFPHQYYVVTFEGVASMHEWLTGS